MTKIERMLTTLQMRGFHHEEVIADGWTGGAVKVPPVPEGHAAVCTMIAGANTGKFQFTLSSDAKIEAGTAVWHDRGKGGSEVLAGPVTGVRGVSVSGEIAIEIAIVPWPWPVRLR